MMRLWRPADCGLKTRENTWRHVMSCIGGRKFTVIYGHSQAQLVRTNWAPVMTEIRRLVVGPDWGPVHFVEVMTNI